MEIRSIKNEKEFKNAVERLFEIRNSSPDTKEFKEAELLTALIDSYQLKNHSLALTLGK